MSFVNRAIERRQRQDVRDVREARTTLAASLDRTVTPMIAHPHRSLPPGMQYHAHSGKSARMRTLRQELKKLQKQARQQGVADPSNDLLSADPIPGPVRAVRQDEGDGA